MNTLLKLAFLLVFVFVCTNGTNTASLLSLPSLNKIHVEDCGRITCAGAGELCNNSFTYCNKSLWCSYVTQTCTPMKLPGEKCDDDEVPCIPGAQCDFFSRVCAIEPYIDPGYACTSDEQCSWLTDGGGYTSSTCNNGLCFSYKEGQKCFHSEQCPAFHFCQGEESKYCVPDLPLGSTCTLRDICAGVSYCNFKDDSPEDNGICTPLFSQPVDAYCTLTNECQEGLTCTYPPDSDTTRCSIPRNPSMNSCLDDDECPVSEVCACDPITGEGVCLNYEFAYPNGITNAYKDIFACLYQYRCGDQACLLTKCKASYCNLLEVEGLSYYKGLPLCLVPDNYVLPLQVC